MKSSGAEDRRTFLRQAAAAAGLTGAAAPAMAQAQAGGDYRFLPTYARAQGHRSLKQSSHDRTGGNADRWTLAPGGTQELFQSAGPGVITVHHRGAEPESPERTGTATRTGKTVRGPASRHRSATSSV